MVLHLPPGQRPSRPALTLSPMTNNRAAVQRGLDAMKASTGKPFRVALNEGGENPHGRRPHEYRIPFTVTENQVHVLYDRHGTRRLWAKRPLEKRFEE